MSLIERAVANLGSATSDLPPSADGQASRSFQLSQESGASQSMNLGSVIELDLERLKAQGFAVPGGEAWALMNQFRVIKRALVSNAFGHGVPLVANGRRVQVTSALPGEGKSYCAVNLALSLATERDCSVLLIDADMARPSLPAKLGVRRLTV